MGGCASTETNRLNAPRARASRSWQLLPTTHRENLFRSLYIKCIVHLPEHHFSAVNTLPSSSSAGNSAKTNNSEGPPSPPAAGNNQHNASSSPGGGSHANNTTTASAATQQSSTALPTCSTALLQKFALSMSVELFRRRVGVLVDSLLLLDPALSNPSVVNSEHHYQGLLHGGSNTTTHNHTNYTSSIYDGLSGSATRNSTGGGTTMGSGVDPRGQHQQQHLYDQQPAVAGGGGAESNNPMKEKTPLLWGIAFAHMGFSAADVHVFISLLLETIFEACEEAESVYLLAVDGHRCAEDHAKQQHQAAAMMSGSGYSSSSPTSPLSSVTSPPSSLCKTTNCLLCIVNDSAALLMDGGVCGSGGVGGFDEEGGDGSTRAAAAVASAFPPRYTFTKEDAISWTLVFRYLCSDEMLKGFHKSVTALSQLAGHASSLCGLSMWAYGRIQPPPSLCDGGRGRRGRTWAYTGGQGSTPTPNQSQQILQYQGSNLTSHATNSTRPSGGGSSFQHSSNNSSPSSSFQNSQAFINHYHPQQEVTAIRMVSYPPPSEGLWLSDTLFPPRRRDIPILPQSSILLATPNHTNVGGGIGSSPQAGGGVAVWEWDNGLRAAGLDASTSSLLTTASAMVNHATITTSEVIIALSVRAAVLRHRVIYIFGVNCGRDTLLSDVPSDVQVLTDTPVAVISLEMVVGLSMHSTEASAASPQSHSHGASSSSPVDAAASSSSRPGSYLRISLVNNVAHIFSFAGTVACEGWHQHISTAKASFTYNAYFDDIPCESAYPTCINNTTTSANPVALIRVPDLVNGGGGGGSSVLSSSTKGGGGGSSVNSGMAGSGVVVGVAGGSSKVVARSGKGGGNSNSHSNNTIHPPPAAIFMPRTDINYTALFIRQSLPFTARLSDFEFGHLLGAGNFGRVIKCFHKHSNRTFALKIIKKERFRGVRNVVEVRRERRVLEASNHPYIMKIHHTYQSPDRVYFLLDYLPGGELLRHTQRAPNHHFSESYCRFYLAQLVCALEYLRIHQLLHRDIKGDNLVLDEAGNLVLTDFGFAKKMRPGVANRTCCGTLAYIAPEMLVSSPQGYGYEVDWWSTGVVLFTILTGFFPFLKSKRKETIEAITTHALQFPPKPAVSPQAADLCSRLLEKVPSRRIRTLKQVKEHAWFNGFDWEGVESKSVRPPYRPLGSQADPPAATSTTPPPPPAGGAPTAAGGVGDQGGGQQPQPAASNKDDTLQRDIQDAAQVGYDVPDDFTDQQDVFGPLYAPQEAAGSNREDNSSESDNDDLETHYTKGLDRLLGGAPFTSILNAGMLGGGGGGGGGPGASGGGWGGMDGSGSNRYQLSSNSLVAMS